MPPQSAYRARINRVLDYIDAHLDEELRLRDLARVAAFSPFHFHRIFAAMMGETVSQCIARLRLQRAASNLLQYPHVSITEIALDCGFAGSASFARAFKTAYGMSAGAWRRGGYENSKMSKTDSKTGQSFGKLRKAFELSSMYIDPVTNNQSWRIQMKTQANLKADVRIQVLPQETVAYVRHIGPYQGDEQLFAKLFDRLFKWAGARDLLNFPDTQCMSVYHDDPQLVEEEKLRVSICLTVPEDTQVDGDVGKMTLEGGKYALGRFELDATEYGEAWGAMYAGWLPDSGYQPDDRPAMERYLNDPNEHPEGKHIVEIAIPVKPL